MHFAAIKNKIFTKQILGKTLRAIFALQFSNTPETRFFFSAGLVGKQEFPVTKDLPISCWQNKMHGVEGLSVICSQLNLWYLRSIPLQQTSENLIDHDILKLLKNKAASSLLDPQQRNVFVIGGDEKCHQYYTEYKTMYYKM